MERKKPNFERTKEYKIAEKTVEILDKKYPCGVHEVYKWLDPLNVLEIVSAFEKAKKCIEKQKVRIQKKEQTERIIDKDITGFPGDCCD